MPDFRTANRLTPDDVARWRWAMRECENQNVQMARLFEQRNTLLELINERYELVDGDQFQPDGTIHRRPRPPVPAESAANVVPLVEEKKEA